jgi:hypothetical protein
MRHRPYLDALSLAICLVAGVGFATGQTSVAPVYNPRVIEFDSPDHDTLYGYRVEASRQDAKDDILTACEVPVANVIVLPAPLPPALQRYQIQLADAGCQPVPMGVSYVWRVVALRSDGEGVSDFSNVGRYSVCVGSNGVVQPLSIVIESIPALVAGKPSTLTLGISAPDPVHIVTIDLVTDGQPAWYYVSPNTDLRGSHQYTFWPVRAMSSLVTLEATDERGCRTTVTPITLTVTSGG